MALAVVLAACGAGRPVAVPGVVPASDAAPAPDAAETLARVDVATPVDQSVADPAPPRPTTTAAVPVESTTTTTTAPISTIVATDPVPIPVIPAVRGWPAFDLHLQTILTAGSDAMSAAVMYDGELVHEVALGRRTAAGDPVAIGDRFRVASISKVITSITVLRLAQSSQIDLDAPVGEQLAQRVGVATSVGVSAITPRHLLTHRSGIGQYENLMFRRQVESCEQAAATGLGRSLERAPGTTLRYSNLNFCLLGLLIEEVTGRPYADVVRDELLAPLGIDGMRLAGTFDVGDGDVEHRSDEGRNYMEVLGAAGSWIASPTDVTTIIDALDLTTAGWKPLGPELLAVMTAITVDPPAPPDPTLAPAVTAVPPPAPTRGYGMGLMIFGPDSFGHTGTLESTHAMTGRRADGYTWAITVSGDHPSSSRDLAGIVDTALRYAGVIAT
jgi:D-alanyl-D-alanine carboxypeptidase